MSSRSSTGATFFSLMILADSSLTYTITCPSASFQISLSAPPPRTLNRLQKDAIWSKVATKSAQLAEQAQSMLDTEQAVLIPLVALQVPAKEQHALNNAILRKLGLWDSRLHLVNMYQTIKDDPKEYAQFQKTIPSVAQRMIPRWKRLLYDPAMSMLDEMESK